MVLVVSGQVLEEAPSDCRAMITSQPGLKHAAQQLTCMPCKVVGPCGLLYVQQREMAATVPLDKNVAVLGSGDSSTCIIVVLRHPVSGAVALAHLDGSGTDDAIAQMVVRVQELTAYSSPPPPSTPSQSSMSDRLQLHLIGGYSDPRRYSEDILHNILHAFHKQPVEIELSLACVIEFNTHIRGDIPAPILYGVGVNVKTGEIFPASFPDKGPDQAVRGARLFTGGQQVLDIYDPALGLLRIGPFNYDPLRGVDLWLEQNDQFILTHLSTSPDVEPPNFVSKVRESLKYIQQHPFPAVTVFLDNRPHYYRRDEMTGSWVPVRY